MAFSWAWRFRAAVAVVLIALSLAAAPTVAGHHFYDPYGQRGYVWHQFYWNGTIWVTSAVCNDREADAYTRINNSTTGTSEFANRWSGGLGFVQKTCDGIVTSEIDIKISYESGPGVEGLWGYNHSTDAPISWCNMVDVPYPCGSHPSVVHINQDEWNSRGHMWRERLIMHETGHSLGLAHHCLGVKGDLSTAEDSVMNTPEGVGSSCTEENWTDVMIWKGRDRATYVTVYSDWQGP